MDKPITQDYALMFAFLGLAITKLPAELFLQTLPRCQD